jgi:hypothetical protein
MMCWKMLFFFMAKIVRRDKFELQHNQSIKTSQSLQGEKNDIEARKERMLKPSSLQA